MIGICDANAILCCMMVNDKGLAGSADYPVEWTREDDPAALVPAAAEPHYRGLMNGSVLRYIAERVSNCREGPTKTPACRLNGTAYSLGTTTNGKPRLWEAVERSVHLSKELLRKDLAARLPANDARHAADCLNQWSQTQAEMLVELQQKPQ